MGPVYSGAMANCNEAIRPLHDRMPVLLHPHEYEQWLRGSFEDLLAFQKRCFPDDLIELQPTSEPWVKKKAPTLTEAPSLPRLSRASGPALLGQSGHAGPLLDPPAVGEVDQVADQVEQPGLR
jgi:hypothetical protein